MRIGRGGAGVGTGTHLAAGLATVGVAGYLYAAVVGRVFEGPAGAGHVSALVSLYFLVNIIGPGVFTALEQETSRAVSAAAVTGRSIRPPALRAARLAAAACAGLTAVVLVGWPLLLSDVLQGDVGLLVALVIAIIGSAGVYWLRGVLGGQQRFRAYAGTFYVEGLARLLPLVVLLLVASQDPTSYGLVFAAGSAVAALAVWPALRMPADPAGELADARMARSFALLVGATALSQTIANLAPVVVAYRLVDDVAAAVFQNAFLLARVPLFLFAPVLAVLLPRLTRDVVQGRFDRFSRLLGRTVALLLVVGGAGVAAGALVGPWAVQVLFNTVERPDAATLALLGAATVLMMTALVLQPALVALGRQSTVTAGWGLGAVVFVLVLVGPLEPVAGALLAQLLGPLAVTAYLAVGTRRALGAAGAARPRPGSIEVHG